ncbi:unnamed protein product [Oppiella nova]|uniref:Caspase family p20 domain-containing protein n=1 Tax=Oppiella nova TaxID=334625 RepID=A0A7R9LEP4_9ACAR|nr:unnamed protein product [Oppiella nova]CAG2162910.1 unnamed protein product [Oppiella nova]
MPLCLALRRTRILNLNTEREKILFILLEFTRERSTCETIVDLLVESNQNGVAQIILKCNTSMGPNSPKNSTEIAVTKCKSPKKGSNFYPMLKMPRGKFIIINNINELAKETQRFNSVFSQLHFDIFVYNHLTAVDIETNLRHNSRIIDKNCDAFGLMIISHGEDERILGTDACNAVDSLRDDPFNIQATSKQTYFDNGITYFGQALSHSIAQYACEESLNSIMCRTTNLLRRFCIQMGFKLTGAPEITSRAALEVYFNP